jgi:hypothetical protein
MNTYGKWGEGDPVIVNQNPPAGGMGYVWEGVCYIPS